MGLDLTGIALTYVESTCFVTDDGDPVINVVFSGHLPRRGRRPDLADPPRGRAAVLSLRERQ
ncbi:hypothetical protein [Streptosporangium saharense]|uniref:hypothetical protein n=1 Tax=Streptosporangium saharense TaxID=1706840 RepID=UPI00343345B8